MKRTPHRRRLIAFSLVSALAVSVGAAQVSATTPPEFEVQPLTGLPIDGALITYTPRPAMVVKIDNVDAEPQSGLNEADIVFEEIVEGRATRFAAVFNSLDSDPVGPIRSGRTQDVNIAAAFNDPIFVWSGGNAGVTGVLQGTGMTLLDQGAPSMHRDNTYHGAPHNLFANTSELWAQAGESGNAEPIFQYTEMGAEIAGEAAAAFDVLVGHVNVNWTYNVEQGLWLRSQQGSPHDTTTGQMSTNNVVVILTGYGTSAHGGGPEAVTTGGGQAIVYSRGRKVEGQWSRANPTDPWTLTGAGGGQILLQPGRTFVELVDGADFTLTDA